MFKHRLLSCLMALAGAAATSGASAQDGWSDWVEVRQATPYSPVSVAYKTKVNNDEIRVVWRCVNEGGEPKTCSVGAGENKLYNCFSGYTNVGTTEALGESATVEPGSDYVFVGEPACQGLGADSLNAMVQVSIED